MSNLELIAKKIVESKGGIKPLSSKKKATVFFSFIVSTK